MAANAVATVSMASAPVKSAAVPVPQKAAKAESPIPAEERDGLPPMGIPGTAASPDTLRVNVARLESLMNLAGELVLCRNQLLEAIAREDARSIGISGQRINLVTSELQDAIMQTRMQPVGSVFGKFTRLVRDMARNLDKEIQLRIEGRDVEIDKTLIEGLSDPLTHMVRNAVDHGLESREERRIAGKSPCGAITLKAGHEAGQVVIEVSDDGKGINPARIAAKAVEKGLVSAEQVKAMSDKDKTSLVFLPGLSTAEKVTDISGRGVGMDVVKTNLDRLGGKVEILSELGKGTLFRIKLPLTLAIIPSLIVSVGAERFAVPQINVVELLRIPAGEVRKRLEVVGGVEVLVLRGELIPVVRFADELGLEKIFIDPLTNEQKPDRREHIADRRSPRHPTHRCESGQAADDQARRQGQSETDRRDAPDRRYRASSGLNIIVLTTGMMRYGLAVDRFHHTEEIVVKPLGWHLKELHEYAGATIMGDGKVALILDVSGLATMTGLSPLTATSRAADLAEDAARDQLRDTHTLLLFQNAPGEHCAVPLDLVLRVERIEAKQIETAGRRRTMQYRGASLPLVCLSDAGCLSPLTNQDNLAVIITSVAQREIGLLGTMPIDVIDAKAEIDGATLRQKGISGSMIVRDKTVLLVDVFELVEAVHPEWIPKREERRHESSIAPVILLAEDSDFFRNQVRRFMESEGYTVIAAEDGQQAWELLQKNADKIQLLVTDIEMPRMNGLELAKLARSDKRFSGLPIICVTSLADSEDVARGKAAGITDYQVKLDREQLLQSIRTLLEEQ
jgi:two-component system chemotaxis sensor kinase CheA